MVGFTTFANKRYQQNIKNYCNKLIFLKYLNSSWSKYSVPGVSLSLATRKADSIFEIDPVNLTVVVGQYIQYLKYLVL